MTNAWWGCLSLVVVLVGCGPASQDEPPPTPAGVPHVGKSGRDAREILERSAKALRSIASVRYEFEMGGPESAAGWLTGSATLVRRTRFEDAAIYVRGTVRAQPAFGVKERAFVWATDGEQAWARDGEAEAVVAPLGKGSNALSATAVYAILPEFIEPDPYWRELNVSAALSVLPSERIHGRSSDRVLVTYRSADRIEAETTWWVDQEDGLPRRCLWRAPFTGPDGIVLTLADVQAGVSLTAAELRPPPGSRKLEARIIGLGELVPPWALGSSTGSLIRSQELRGKVVVLDFWNTWCPVCRGLAPATRQLAAEFADQAVQVLGVNIFETGDPLSHWQASAPVYPTLLKGEELGNSLDLPWQPAVAVIDGEGILRFKQLGASGDRTDRVRQAIVSILARERKAASR
jgi:thiol-disulfide isomerase/thioredoxin